MDIFKMLADLLYYAKEGRAQEETRQRWQGFDWDEAVKGRITDAPVYNRGGVTDPRRSRIKMLDPNRMPMQDRMPEPKLERRKLEQDLLDGIHPNITFKPPRLDA